WRLTIRRTRSSSPRSSASHSAPPRFLFSGRLRRAGSLFTAAVAERGELARLRWIELDRSRLQTEQGLRRDVPAALLELGAQRLRLLRPLPREVDALSRIVHEVEEVPHRALLRLVGRERRDRVQRREVALAAQHRHPSVRDPAPLPARLLVAAHLHRRRAVRG